MNEGNNGRRTARRRRLRLQRTLAAGAVLVLLAGVFEVHRHGGLRHVFQRVHDKLLIAAGAANNRLTDAHGAKVVRFDFQSKTLGQKLDEIVVLPDGFTKEQKRPLLVFLHGRNSHPSTLLNNELTDALKRAGAGAPVVLLANGGGHSYYHDRRDGKWGSYVSHELVNDTVKKYHLDPKRVAYAGISMGGYGAFELTLEADRHLCGVAGLAPALWNSAGETAPGAFDDAEDFNAHDPLGAARTNNNAFHGTPVFLAGGSDDPFRTGTDAMATALRGGPSSVVRRRGSGGHNSLYWNPQFGPMVKWFAQRFKEC